MENFTKNEVLPLITLYRESQISRQAIIEGFLDQLEGAIDEEIKFQRLELTKHERAAEASFALLEAFSVYEANQDNNFLRVFRTALRRNIKRLCSRKGFISIEGLSIEDRNPNPEEQYILKEQLDLIKAFLTKYYTQDTIDQFMRRYADGEKLREIADDYDISTAALVEKMNRVLARASKYMKRINNE